MVGDSRGMVSEQGGSPPSRNTNTLRVTRDSSCSTLKAKLGINLRDLRECIADAGTTDRVVAEYQVFVRLWSGSEDTIEVCSDVCLAVIENRAFVAIRARQERYLGDVARQSCCGTVKNKGVAVRDGSECKSEVLDCVFDRGRRECANTGEGRSRREAIGSVGQTVPRCIGVCADGTECDLSRLFDGSTERGVTGERGDMCVYREGTC